MNFTSNMLGIFDPTHGLLSNFTKPDKAAGAASKATLKAAGMIPGFGMIAKYFKPKSNPNTAGLKNQQKARIQVNGGNYDNTIKASKRDQVVKHNKSGIAEATAAAYRTKTPQDIMKNYGMAKPGGCVVPRNVLSDMRRLKSPLELDTKLAGML